MNRIAFAPSILGRLSDVLTFAIMAGLTLHGALDQLYSPKLLDPSLPAVARAITRLRSSVEASICRSPATVSVAP